MTAGALLHAGLPLPARALLQMQSAAFEDDDRPSELLSALSQATDIPLLLRDDPPLAPCPEGVPWKDRFTEAEKAVGAGDWQTGAERLTALAADVPDAPVVWRNLATLRGWLADNAGCADALRKYAALRAREADGLEDAVEAEAEAMFLAEDPLGDRLEMFKLVWTVKDVERAQEAFLWSPRFRAVPFDPAQFSDGQTPPPKAAYMLLDRPMPESAEGLSLETVPRLLGQALLFGRQTDCEARLDVMGVAGDELQAVKDMVREAAGDALDPQPKEEVVGHWSASQKLLRAAWQPPRGASAEQLRTLVDQHRRDAILNRWPELKLGILDGRSPREVAGVDRLTTCSTATDLSRPPAGGDPGAGKLVGAAAGRVRFQRTPRPTRPAGPRTDRSAAALGRGPAGGAARAAERGRAFRRRSALGFSHVRRPSPSGPPCGSSPRPSSIAPVSPTRTSGSMPMPPWPARKRTLPRHWNTSIKDGVPPRRRSCPARLGT